MNTAAQTQAMIYENVMVRRGYGAGKTPDQIAAMQVAKLVEEVGEYAETITNIPPYLPIDLDLAANTARSLFHMPQLWRAATVSDREQAAQELADIGVTWLCACEALGLDGMSIALAKSDKDAIRGVR